MTKRDIVERVSEKTGVAQAQVASVVEQTLEVITESLSRGQGVELRNFGVFEVRQRKPRTGRNPANPSQEYAIPAHAVVKFKPGKEMRARVKEKATAARPAAPAMPSAAPRPAI